MFICEFVEIIKIFPNTFKVSLWKKWGNFNKSQSQRWTLLVQAQCNKMWLKTLMSSMKLIISHNISSLSFGVAQINTVESQCQEHFQKVYFSHGAWQRNKIISFPFHAWFLTGLHWLRNDKLHLFSHHCYQLGDERRKN